MDIINAFSLLNKVGSTTKRNEKIELLKSGIDNEDFLTILKLAYDPFKNFWIFKIKKLKGLGDYTETLEKTPNVLQVRFFEFLDITEQLSQRKVTGNAAITLLHTFLQSCTEEEYMWYSRVIKKDLRIGIAEGTLIQAFGKGFIPQFHCILANALDSLEDIKKLPKQAYIEPKLDGMRILAEVTDEHVVLRSRNGKTVVGYDQLEQQLSEYMPHGYMYDGELMSPEFHKRLKEMIESGASAEGLTKTGVDFNDLMSAAFSKTNNKVGIYNMFDMVPLEVFKVEGTTDLSQIERKEALQAIYQGIEDKTKCTAFRVISNTQVYDTTNTQHIELIKQYYEECLDLGYEGIMIKDATMPYIYKRTKQLLKIKPVEYLDLPVIDMVEGNGSLQGSLGALVVDYNGNTTNVGSGFTDAERKLFWEHPQDIIGKTIMVALQETTQNKQGTSSIRFGRFKGIREDK